MNYEELTPNERELLEMFNRLTPENKKKAIEKARELSKKQGGAKMTIEELNKEQLTQVKQNYYTQKQAEKGEGVSYGELSMIDTLVSDSEIFEEYQGVEFVPADFV